jgi:hypothetical protein
VSFLFGCFASELAFHALLSLTVIVALLLRGGALATRAGQIGLGLSLAAAALLVISCVQSVRCHAVVERAMGELPRALDWRQLMLPIPRPPSDVERIANVLYHQDDGWNHRLSPRATHPDHIVDVKRAIAWVRAHAHEWGVDPSFAGAAGAVDVLPG